MNYEVVSRGKDLKKYDCIVIGVFSGDEGKKSELKNLVAEVFSVDIDRVRKEEKFKSTDSEEFLLRVPGVDGTSRILFMGLGKWENKSAVLFKRRMLRAGLAIRARGYESSALLLPDCAIESKDFLESALMGFSIGLSQPFRLKFKSSNENKSSKVSRVGIYCKSKDVKTVDGTINFVKKIAPVISRVRDLVDKPANLLGTQEMVEEARKMVEGENVKIRIHKLDGKNHGNFPLVYEVGKGSSRAPLVMEMKYSPKGSGKRKKVCLVGKGIVFDSGGLNLKTFHSMSAMKNDMAGAATVVGCLVSSARLGLNVDLYGICPLAENFPSSNSYRPGDIIKSKSGKTIEIISTDAEGRLLLSDALTWAVEQKPDYIIDIATLTGACMVALGSFTAGLFSNDDDLAKQIEDGAKEAGEMLWRLPLLEEMVPSLRSDIADLKNASQDPYGGAIFAALFLREFVGNKKWAHLDIAGPAYFDKRTEMGPRGATGFGVHTLIKFLQKVSV